MFFRSFSATSIIYLVTKHEIFCNLYASRLLSPINNYRCPPYFNVTDCTNEITFYLWKARDHSFTNEVKHVVNLNKIVDIFLETHFLLILTNFRGATFPEPSYPVILRSERITYLWSFQDGRWTLKSEVFVPEEVLTQKLYANRSSLVLDVSKYWTRWNNPVSIYLFPRIRFSQIPNRHAYHDFYAKKIKSVYNIFPSAVSPIKIFIRDGLHKYENNDLTSLISDLNKATNAYATFYVAETSFSLSGEIFADSEVSIGKLKIIQLCLGEFWTLVNYVAIKSPWNIIGDAAEIQKSVTPQLCNGNPVENKLEFFFAMSKSSSYINDPLIWGIWEALQTCSSPNPPTKLLLPESGPVSEAYASIWLSVMGNISYITRGHRYLRKCYDGKYLAKLGFRKLEGVSLDIVRTFNSSHISATFFYAVVTSVFNDLQFVTCGYQGYERLQFMELLIAFDRTVWVVLIIFMFALALIFQQIPPASWHFSFSGSTLIPVKLLLEQSNPFPEALISIHRCKWIVGALLLMGIILSNAYKNANVYNMIIPRKLVPYKHLTELVRDQFKIYTRSKSVSLSSNLPLRTFWENQNDTSKQLKQTHLESHCVVYEFPFKEHLSIRHDSDVADLHAFAEKSELPQVYNKSTYLLYVKTSLIPLTMSFLYKVVNGIKNPELLTPLQLLLAFDRQFLQQESDILRNSLKKCSKSAVVIPTYLGYKFVKQLVKEGIDHVYQGAETYYEMNLVFEVKGQFPRYVVQRARYAERCGLWKRWRRLFKGRYIRKVVKRTGPLETPTMKGNVIVIFLLLEAGLVAALVFFRFEVWFSKI